MTESLRIGIVGLGLIGGSLALALRRSGEPIELVGIDSDAKTLALARKAGAIDFAVLPEQAAWDECDVVVLCTPAPALLGDLPRIANAMQRGALLTDVCGVKQAPCALGAMQTNVVFAGAHPMAGTEQRGFAFARADLFDGAAVALCPASGVAESHPQWRAAAEDSIRALWRAAGATRFLALDPEAHDRAVAFASHLPALTAAALFEALEKSGPQVAPQARALAAGGFRDTTRLAADGTVGQAAVHNRFIPEAARALGLTLLDLARQIEDGLHTKDLRALATRLEDLADRRRAMPLPPVRSAATAASTKRKRR